MTDSHRKFLKIETHDTHEELDQLSQRIDFSNKDHYRRFLEAHLQPTATIELSLNKHGISRLFSDWDMRQRLSLLVEDLVDLTGVMPIYGMDAIEKTSVDEMLGMLYVLEGSRVGAQMILKNVNKTLPELGAVAVRYLSTDMKNWTTFVDMLDSRDAERTQLLKGATFAFSLFLDSFRKSFMQGVL